MALKSRMGKNFQDGYAGETIANLFDELDSDTINLRIMWEDIIITKDPRVIQTVLATGFDKFHKGPLLKVLLRGLFGDGIFNNDGEEWKAHRALTKPFFGLSPTAHIMIPLLTFSKLVNGYRTSIFSIVIPTN